MRKALDDALRHALFIPVVLGLSVALVLAGIAIMSVKSNAGSGTTQAGGVSTLVAVSVAGEVAVPGVYTLPTTARVVGLLNAAGGVLADADIAHINLAAPLFDGMAVFVPKQGAVGVTGTVAPTIKVNINTADAATMIAQLGLTKKTADAIVAYRQKHGLYTAIDQLLLVPVSKTVYGRIKDKVTV